jgi:NTE family protein
VEKIQKELMTALRTAQSYQEWTEAAVELDRIEGADAWKNEDASDDYDWRLIRSRIRQINQYRETKDHRKLIHHLRQGLHWNLGNTGNTDLYAYTRVGTKRLITEYLHAVVESLELVSHLPSSDFPYAEKHKFFRDVTLSYGRSALMLSGGATLGLFHVGVARALFREGLLPTVLSGSSAGSVVAAIISCTPREDAEKLMALENAYYNFWRILPFKQMLRRGAVMDQNQLRQAIAMNMDDCTFEEAQRRSGRIVNITVSPAGSNQAPKLLNYLTFPYLYIREAVLASCAVPILFPPVMLMSQSEVGERTPYMPLLRWNDGSLKSDLPMLRLRRLHNVNHFIVSQTNPHVLPFVSRQEAGNGLVGATREMAFSTARSAATGLLRAGKLLPFSKIRQPLDTAAGLLDQDYRGNINIVPEVSLWRYANVTSNPSMGSIKRFIFEGERATWPRMEMIRNQTLISNTLERCLSRIETEGDRPVEDQPRARRTELKIVRS